MKEFSFYLEHHTISPYRVGLTPSDNVLGKNAAFGTACESYAIDWLQEDGWILIDKKEIFSFEFTTKIELRHVVERHADGDEVVEKEHTVPFNNIITHHTIRPRYSTCFSENQKEFIYNSHTRGSSSHLSYDLLAMKDSRPFFIEVKGTQNGENGFSSADKSQMMVFQKMKELSMPFLFCFIVVKDNEVSKIWLSDISKVRFAGKRIVPLTSKHGFNLASFFKDK